MNKRHRSRGSSNAPSHRIYYFGETVSQNHSTEILSLLTHQVECRALLKPLAAATNSRPDWLHLMDSCTLTAEVTGRQHPRSATQRKLVVPRYRLNSFSRRRFFVVGPSTWNLLPDSLRDPELSLDTFKRQLKTYIFAKY